MKFKPLLLIISILSACSPKAILSGSEKSQGWVLLFDGKTTNGWRGAYSTSFPEHGWVVKHGELRGELHAGAESGDAGDIVTLNKYRDFELVFNWKLGKGGNSGVKYFIEERQPKPSGSQAGYEYQLIDDADYVYNGKKLPQDLKTGSIYDIIPAQKPDSKVEVWHLSRILVKGNLIEHWLDGEKVVDIDRESDTFKKGLVESKFKDYPGFGSIREGHILLQDHGHSVAFKNIKIKQL